MRSHRLGDLRTLTHQAISGPADYGPEQIPDHLTNTQVKCDVCWGIMDGRYDTREDADQAAVELDWRQPGGGMLCPEHAQETA